MFIEKVPVKPGLSASTRRVLIMQRKTVLQAERMEPSFTGNIIRKEKAAQKQWNRII